MSKNKFPIIADPSKKFFIEMLTRDISLVDCILDLIDNSVDSILIKTGFDPMKGLLKKERISLNAYRISIHFDKKEFIIEDNSTGITKEEAKKNIFRFGADAEKKKKIGLSVYGIGMKRSFLKMGRNIFFESINKNKELIKVKVDVLEWTKEESWDFEGEFEDAIKYKKTGTKIKVIDLYDQVSFNFESSSFSAKLLKKIGEVYGIFLLNNLNIEVNGKKASPLIPKIAESKILKPSIETFKRDNVKIKIIAGISHEDSKSLNGWYIFCNGRLIVSGDKTEKTGWGGENLRKFHSSTQRFVGFVYFESNEADKLPWTTTKDGVNYDSAIYQYTLNEMVKMAQPVVSYLTKLYGVYKNMEEMRELMQNTKEVSLENLTLSNQKFIAPEIDGKKSKDKKERILYTIPSKDIKKAKEILGDNDISNSKLGEKTFYYYIEYQE